MCKYCEGHYLTFGRFENITYDIEIIDNTIIIIMYDGNNISISHEEINYCPMCGRKFKKPKRCCPTCGKVL